MQPLTAEPRDSFTADQVVAALTAADQHWSYGVDLLDTHLNFVDDLSPDVSACVVSRDCTRAPHGAINLTLARELRWGADRVRPYIVLDSNAAGVSGMRFNLGVYIPQTPESTVGQIPVAWQVTGQDQLALLQYNLSDSYSIAAGANVFDAIRGLISMAGLTVPVQLDSSQAAAVYPAGGRTWPLFSDGTGVGGQPESGPFSYLTVINDLLTAVGYVGLWADWDGTLRSQAAAHYDLRPVEWTLLVGDLKAGVVSDRKASWDVWQSHNRWTFYMNGLSAQPVEGISAYTRDNLDIGPSSQLQVGIRQAPPQGLDAVDYPTLVAQGDAIADAEARGTRTLTLSTSKMPAFWHRDIVQFTDPAMPAVNWLLAGETWSLNLADVSDESSTWQVVG